ncbi:type II CAAX endopeptidase family protein [Bacillus cereus]|uniref:CPBP family intramembrane glutamic endopeptidase n=1 Tax=Bacillus cereus group TaxID=86661 RepID=UPI000BF9F8A6|nr:MULTISPECIES: type II CAAX endopeptidase family protein [Bacillus cereus group]MCU7754102.1 CPBP family intramembrane metalloprotease [Bacillus cereus]MDA2624331.1 type II CAAX endopeptidase family protein [Bacillus cereus]MDC7749448.1 type II CAAX endopeptidase family protein [Bacillus cereus]PFD06556.1 CPBP family intramembrane metalloprotease [Bacillus cereus]PGV79084.1 CPBP family intramembrane metalloprotease [Bacillus cereus]
MNFIKTNKKDLIMLVVFTMFVIFQIGVLILVGVLLLTNVNLVESEFATTVAAFIVPAIIGISFYRKEILQSFSYFKEKTILKVISIPMVVLLTLILETFVTKFLVNTDQSVNQDLVNQAASEVPFIFAVLLVGVVGPIVEEIVFRYILVNKFSSYVGTAIASIVSILLFTVLHSQNLSDFAIYLPGSVIYTVAYLISKRSLAYIIAIHVLNNVLSLIL